jgi:NADH:ubiquinone oxidoreductase subunit H
MDGSCPKWVSPHRWLSPFTVGATVTTVHWVCGREQDDGKLSRPVRRRVILSLRVILAIYTFFLLQTVAFFTLMERHVLGLSQHRFGPKKTRWFGLIQPLIDGIKLCKKEQILLFNCSPRVFLGAALARFGLFYMEFLALPYPLSFITIY